MKQFNLPILLAIATASLLLYGCILGPERGSCEGSLTLENPIPDTTVAVGDTLLIDLTNPPVFVSSKGRVSYSYSILTGIQNVDLSVIADPNDAEGRLLIIVGETTGEAMVEILASSGCLENSQKLDINIIDR